MNAAASRTRRTLLVCSVLLGACGPSATRVLVQISATGPAIQSLAIEVTTDGAGGSTLQTLPTSGGPPTLPGAILLTLEDASRGLTVKLVALDEHGDPRVTSGHVQPAEAEQVELALALDAPALRPELATGPPSWLPAAPVTVGRGGGAAATGADGRIYLLGGAQDTSVLTSVEAYSPALDTWTPVHDLTVGRWAPAAVAAADGQIYAISGMGNGGVPQRGVERYTPSTDMWTLAPELGRGRWGLAAVVGGDSAIYVVGGGGPDYVGTPEQMIPPGTWSWLMMAELPTLRAYLAAAPAPDGATIYAIGGEHPPTLMSGCCTMNPFSTVEAFTLASRSWRSVAGLPTPISRLAAVTGPDRRIYAIGGVGTDGQPRTQVNAFDPQTDRWTAVASMANTHELPGAAVGPDGRIYAIAGNGPAGSVDVYGPKVTVTRSGDRTVNVTGANFAASAEVVAVLVPSMAVAGSGRTDALGALASAISLSITPGTTAIRLVDDRSRYPITVAIPAQ